MKSFFISKKHFYLITLGLLFTLTFVDGFLFLVFLSFFVVYLYIHRKNKVVLRDAISNSSNVLLSPISGTFKGVTEKDNKLVIELRSKLFGPLGIYMPSSANILNYNKSQNCVILKNKDDVEVKLCFKSRFSLWVEAGDIARVRANIGYLSFLGKMYIELPKGTQLLINKNNRIKAGETILAGIGS